MNLNSINTLLNVKLKYENIPENIISNANTIHSIIKYWNNTNLYKINRSIDNKSTYTKNTNTCDSGTQYLNNLNMPFNIYSNFHTRRDQEQDREQEQDEDQDHEQDEDHEQDQDQEQEQEQDRDRDRDRDRNRKRNRKQESDLDSYSDSDDSISEIEFADFDQDKIQKILSLDKSELDIARSSKGFDIKKNPNYKIYTN